MGLKILTQTFSYTMMKKSFILFIIFSFLFVCSMCINNIPKKSTTIITTTTTVTTSTITTTTTGGNISDLFNNPDDIEPPLPSI